jgi:hypothetical protein
MFVNLNAMTDEAYQAFMEKYQEKVFGIIIEAEFEMVEKKETFRDKIGKLVETIKSIRK